MAFPTNPADGDNYTNPHTGVEYVYIDDRGWVVVDSSIPDGDYVLAPYRPHIYDTGETTADPPPGYSNWDELQIGELAYTIDNLELLIYGGVGPDGNGQWFQTATDFSSDIVALESGLATRS